jgi:hypothetical protein
MANKKQKKPEHDTHGTPIERSHGPGPKDADAGALGKQAGERIDRVEGEPERRSDGKGDHEPGKRQLDAREDEGEETGE